MGAGPSLILFDAAVGAADGSAGCPPGGVAPLRDTVARLARWAQVTALTTGSPSGADPDATRRARSVVLAWVGGWSWHASRVAPLLEALDLPGCLFVPVERLGCPGAMGLESLAQLARIPALQVGLDLSGTLPASSRDLDRHLKNGCRLMAFHGGRQPRAAYLGGFPCDRRVGFLLAQHGIRETVTHGAPRSRPNPFVRVWPAGRPPWFLRWRLENLRCEVLARRG